MISVKQMLLVQVELPFLKGRWAIEIHNGIHFDTYQENKIWAINNLVLNSILDPHCFYQSHTGVRYGRKLGYTTGGYAKTR